jgi:tryptophan halogenase
MITERYKFVRDFIVLHYKVTQRSDSEFWRYCANMPIPDTLKHQIELFRETGHVAIYDPEGFSSSSYFSILMGLGQAPKTDDPLIDAMQFDELLGHFASRREIINEVVKAMPEHGQYISLQCKAP